MIEADILHRAVESLEKLTKADIRILQEEFVNGHRWDALLDIRTGAGAGRFKVEVQGNVVPATLPRLVDKLVAEQGLLVAKYISTPGRELLETKGINYLDIAGNCYIRHESGIFWHVKGQRLPSEFREARRMAFNKNGIKLIYALLLKENLVNESYRVMAEMAGISGSTVGYVLKDLSVSKHLYQLNDNSKLLVNKRELLSQWVTAFNQKLKPKLFRGKYRFGKGVENWQTLDLGNAAYWGGEPAAELLTHYLQAGTWTIYSNLDRRALLQDFRLVPDPERGNVEVYSLFWNELDVSFINSPLKTVNPLLVYADLIGSGNDRNFETATRIYEQHLKSIILDKKEG